MSADLLLSRLQHVRATGPTSWRADCPNGHERSRGSLAITVADDGRILLTCFACHDTPAILAAVGLGLADLFPDRLYDASPGARKLARVAFKRDGWRAALNVLRREATVVSAAAVLIRHDKVISVEDHNRLSLAMQRIGDAKDLLA